jgi:hypothetical protein
MSDTVVTAWATREHGPGWSNTPVWVLLRADDGRLRVECIQPEEQSAAMRTLHGVSAAAAGAMTAAVAGVVWDAAVRGEEG